MNANRELFLSAFARFAAGDVDVLHEVLHDDFVEHNPANPSGREAFVAHMKQSPVATARFEIERVVADDEHVVAHYRMYEGEQVTEVVDIWRFEAGRIVEHWDVLQPLANDQPLAEEVRP